MSLKRPTPAIIAGIMGFTAWYYYAHARVPRTSTPSDSRAIPLSTVKTPSNTREGRIEAAKVSEIQLNHMLRLRCPSLCLAVGVCTYVGTPHGPKRLGIPGWSAERERMAAAGIFSNKNLNAANLSQEE